MLMIRLSRRGARKQPYYRIVVIEKDRARDGRSVEVVGTYNPRTDPATVDLKRERIRLLDVEGRAVVRPRAETGGEGAGKRTARLRKATNAGSGSLSRSVRVQELQAMPETRQHGCVDGDPGQSAGGGAGRGHGRAF